MRHKIYKILSYLWLKKQQHFFILLIYKLKKKISLKLILIFCLHFCFSCLSINFCLMHERTRLLKNQSHSINQPELVNNNGKVTFVLPSLESETVYKDRLFSIRLCYICMFLSSVSFTICISSIWPFLQIVNIFAFLTCLYLFSCYLTKKIID